MKHLLRSDVPGSTTTSHRSQTKETPSPTNVELRPTKRLIPSSACLLPLVSVQLVTHKFSLRFWARSWSHTTSR